MGTEPGNAVLVPVITGLVEVLKRFGLPSRWAPLASLALGLAGGFLYVAPGIPDQAILSGLILGLAAMGLWSGPKTTVQAFRGLKRG